MRWDEYSWHGEDDPCVYAWDELKDGRMNCWFSYVVFPGGGQKMDEDLVVQLRSFAMGLQGLGSPAPLMRAAADEIERLRELVRIGAAEIVQTERRMVDARNAAVELGWKV